MALHYQVHQSKSEFMYTLQMTCLAFHEGLPANGKKLTVQVHYTIMAARFVHCRLVYNYVASQHLSHTVCTCTISVAYKSQSVPFSKSNEVYPSSLPLSTRPDRHEAGLAHYCSVAVRCSGHYCHCCTQYQTR